ncbi:MAG: hypothetical protein JO297_19840 [Nitrososphaeraceae archaeon]|nr:hypothetical protein [Nitrososphaeraceae archaeon]
MVIANAKTIATSNPKDDEKSESASWWINELDSLGIKKNSSSNEDNNKSGLHISQQLEDFTDDIKQILTIMRSTTVNNIQSG